MGIDRVDAMENTMVVPEVVVMDLLRVDHWEYHKVALTAFYWD